MYGQMPPLLTLVPFWQSSRELLGMGISIHRSTHGTHMPPPHHQGSRFGSFGEDENCKVGKEAGLGINMWNGARHEVSELLACLFSKLVPNQDRADAFPQHGRDGDWMVELRSPGSWGVLRCWLLHNASMFCVQVAGAPCPCFPQYGESITRSSRDV